MGLNADQLLQIAVLVEGAASVREAAAAVRATLPGVRASVVDGLDVRDERAALSIGARRIFLVETEGHCWQVTAEPQRAGAVMLVQD